MGCLVNMRILACQLELRLLWQQCRASIVSACIRCDTGLFAVMFPNLFHCYCIVAKRLECLPPLFGRHVRLLSESALRSCADSVSLDVLRMHLGESRLRHPS